MNKILPLLILVFSFFYTNVFAQQAAVWTSTTSGTLDGVPFTASGFLGSSLNNNDYSTTNYSIPLSASQQNLIYLNDSNWTITFDSPINGFALYLFNWRTATDGTFSQTPTMLSGINFTVLGNNIDVTANFANGIIKFPDGITTLTFNRTATINGLIGMTFTGEGPPTVATAPIPTMSQWGLLIFGLLIMNISVFFVKRRELIQN